MRRVLHVITGLHRGGAEAVLLKVVSGLQESHGFRHHVVSLTGEGPMARHLRDLGVPVSVVDLRRPIALREAVGLFGRVLDEFDPHVIHGWMYHGALASTLAAQLGGRGMRKRAVVWGVHSVLEGVPRRSLSGRAALELSKLLSRRPNVIAYCAEASRSQHLAAGFSSENSCVVFNGFDTTTYRPQPGVRAQLRHEFGVPEGALLVGSIARYHPAKDHRTLVRAFGIVARSAPNCHWLLAGRDVDPSNAELAALLTSAKLGHRVRILGERQDVPRLMAGLDLYVQASRNEALPLTLGEAMSTGIPCVATDVGDSRALLGQTGRLVASRSPAALAAAMLELLQLGASERQGLGTSARRRIEKKFSLHSMVSRYSELYASVSRGLGCQ